MRRIEQRSDRSPKGLATVAAQRSIPLLADAVADLNALIARMTAVRTARAGVCQKQLREFLGT